MVKQQLSCETPARTKRLLLAVPGQSVCVFIWRSVCVLNTATLCGTCTCWSHLPALIATCLKMTQSWRLLCAAALTLVAMSVAVPEGEIVDPQDPEVQACASFALESLSFRDKAHQYSIRRVISVSKAVRLRFSPDLGCTVVASVCILCLCLCSLSVL